MGLVSVSALFVGLFTLQLLVAVSVQKVGALGVAEPNDPPVIFPSRRLVAVQGVVYCKSCKFLGSNTLNEASPLPGALVRLKCNNSKKPVSVEGKTDKYGYFFIQPPKEVTTFGVHKCKVYLVSSPWDSCKHGTDLNGGLSGAYLRYENHAKMIVALYSAGPFAYAPTKCPKHFGPEIFGIGRGFEILDITLDKFRGIVQTKWFLMGSMFSN